MSFGRVIDVDCQCGAALFRYYKSSHGRLIKVLLENIRKDFVGITKTPPQAPVCPACGKEIGVIHLVGGRLALKLNQGTVKPVRL
jgi:hypothetical protein